MLGMAVRVSVPNEAEWTNRQQAITGSIHPSPMPYLMPGKTRKRLETSWPAEGESRLLRTRMVSKASQGKLINPRRKSRAFDATSHRFHGQKQQQQNKEQKRHTKQQPNRTERKGKADL